jgi:peptidoglycan hydrolase CwlO-like protein
MVIKDFVDLWVQTMVAYEMKIKRISSQVDDFQKEIKSLEQNLKSYKKK